MSVGKPEDWNVVIPGAWNPAILTPPWISEHLFGKPHGTVLDVKIALAPGAVPQVSGDGITVDPSGGSLMIAAENPSKGSLAAAARIGMKALTRLPETPIGAAGINIRYSFEDAPNTILEGLKSSVDDGLSDSDRYIVARGFTRKVPWREGVVNITVATDENLVARVAFNFHCDGDNRDDRIVRWLEKCEEATQEAQDLARAMFGLELTVDQGDEDG